MNIETTPIILRELLEKTNSTSAFITSSNGLSIFSIQSDDIEEDLLSAFSATIFSVGERLCYQFKEAALNQIILQSNDRQLIVKPISENSYLTLLTSKNQEIDELIEAMHKSIQYINNPEMYLVEA